MQTLSQNVKTLRLQLNKSVRKVAGEIGISHHSLKNYEENNCEPSVSSLIKISDYYQFDDLRKLITEPLK